ncbi:SPOR domain-containing protein [Candidatus Williamhamiltonella defendens]|uniref:SPOR domain-containing protein n=1 Tax=Candidatus Williamhamiltonella defendens TaxID=138072 RepID=UPI00130ED707|nr:SPOR domain-containing protein [Candidatus Hamiltonella defensa]
MIRKDYVRRDDSQIIYKRQKKKLNRVGISKAVVTLGIALVVILIGCFYFISRDKPKSIKLLMTQNINTNSLLPSKPQERWYYVKELKNRPIDVLTSSESFYDNNPKVQIPLTHEQHELLKQIQFDMRYTGTQLPIVLDTTTPNIQAARKEMMKKSPKSQWLQCAAFREVYQANQLRVQLALEGMESKIHSLDGWNRVLLGPYKNASDARRAFQKLKKIGINTCISINDRG